MSFAEAPSLIPSSCLYRLGRSVERPPLSGLEFILEWVWKKLPEQLFSEGNIDSKWEGLWIPIVGFLMAFLVGCTVRFMGEVSATG